MSFAHPWLPSRFSLKKLNYQVRATYYKKQNSIKENSEYASTLKEKKK